VAFFVNCTVTQNLYRLLSALLGRKHFYLIKGLQYLGRPSRFPVSRLDYVRVATLELLSQEIEERQLPGHVAELGVYRGGFAKYIAGAFPTVPFTSSTPSKALTGET
jgi:O-methyltransferase